ncbi:MAG: hypothetical protein IPO94_15030 [Saprospiraceae bacterium]|nr:hypothetical protein [Saprospiraceae bacterium]
MKDVDANAKKKDIEGNVITTTFYEIPVTVLDEEVTIHLDKVKEIPDEDKKKSLYALNFKTSKKDSEKRYLFGDISYSYFETKKGVEEGGNYRMAKDKKASSFYRCQDAANQLSESIITRFRAAFLSNIEAIEQFLRSKPAIVLHFNFDDKSWFQLDDVTNMIDGLITSKMIVPQDDKFVLDVYLYKTLGGHNTPNFREENKYKTNLFTLDEVKDLLYGVRAAQKPLKRLNKSNIGIVALPHGEGLTSKMIADFLPKMTNEESDYEEEQSENLIIVDNDVMLQNDAGDALFYDFVYNSFDEKVKFDIIFTNIPASPAGLYVDMVEIASIEKSLLVEVNNKINRVKQHLKEQFNQEFPKAKKDLELYLEDSFLKILSNQTKSEKKYQFHLLKVLPLIYTDNYFQDNVILPLFINKVEYNIRNNGQGFNTLKYNFYFLMQIQKFNPLMAITASTSYQIGKCLGIMSKQFEAWRDDCPIKSFEKSYVGNLSRRISSLEDMTKFSNFINEKLTIHERWYPDIKEAYSSFVPLLRELENSKGEYNKNHCSLGFFESYFKVSQSEK